jgi:hypothetical protein
VRAAFFSIQETGQWIGSWTPWYGYSSFPDGIAVRVPAGAHIVAEIYYQAVAQPVIDKATLGLFFADKPTANTISTVSLDAKTASAGDRFRAETRMTADTRALALRLETGQGVKSVEVSSRRMDGGTDVLLFVRDIPADWPTPYIFKEPVLVRRGSVLAVTAHGGPVKVTVSRY